MLSSGNWKALMTSMPLGGHTAAALAPASVTRLALLAAASHTTGAGNSEKSKNAQNQPTKNITSDAMNRIMP